jgi:hypothetical protein
MWSTKTKKLEYHTTDLKQKAQTSLSSGRTKSKGTGILITSCENKGSYYHVTEAELAFIYT